MRRSRMAQHKVDTKGTQNKYKTTLNDKNITMETHNDKYARVTAK